jgi:hypothetical protein
MLLVPRQLKRTGMTGDVPYYGGRFTPQQAYAASHPPRRPPPPPPPAADPTTTLRSLQELLDGGVITPDEYDELRARVAW